MNRTGWICPSYGRGVSPDHATCDHGGQVAQPPQPYVMPLAPTTVPMVPSVWTTPRGCSCKPGDLCMNAFCPNRLIVTCTTGVDGPSSMTGGTC